MRALETDDQNGEAWIELGMYQMAHHQDGAMASFGNAAVLVRLLVLGAALVVCTDTAVLHMMMMLIKMHALWKKYANALVQMYV